MSLTPGGIAPIKAGRASSDGHYPTLIVQSVKSIASNNGGAPRYRLHLSDGGDIVQAMLNTGHGPLVESGEISEGTIVRLDEYIVNELNGQKICIVVQVTVVGKGTASAPAAVPAPAAPAPVASFTPAVNPYVNPYAPAANTNPYSANNRPISHESSAPVGNVVPISALNPYSNRWTIKARITSKTDIRSWSNPKGDGTLFSIDLLDNEGTAIRATFFKAAVDKFFSILAEGNVYFFTAGKVKAANSKFSNIKNSYELTFDERSEIKECFEASDIKKQSYEFVSISNINSKEPNDVIDVLAIVKGASEVSEIVSAKQGGKMLSKRELTILDDSGAEIRLTLWGEKATSPPAFPYEEHPIVAFKGLRVGDFGGRSLSAQGSTAIAFNPDLPEAVQLHTWRQQFQDGVLPTGQSLSSQGRDGGGASDGMDKRKFIHSIKDEGLGFNEKPDFISIKGTVSFIKHENDPWYTACPTEGCNKKVFETNDNKWSCEKCNATFETCQRRFILSLTMSDHTAQVWFSMFNDTAVKMIGKTADELFEMKSNSIEGTSLEVDQIFDQALFKDYVAKVKVKAEMVNDEQRVKSTVLSCNPLNYVQECNDLLSVINRY